MDSFENKIAVVTGGGAGMGRELVRQLAKEGCDIALCDVMEENMQETVDIVSSESPEVKITSFKCDVSLEGDVFSFKDKVIEEHKTDYINLLLIMQESEVEVASYKAIKKNGKKLLLYVGMGFTTAQGLSCLI